MNQDIYNKNLKKIRRVFQENFSRKLGREEVEEILKNLLNYSEKINKGISGFSQERFEHYLRDIEIVFSPNAIFHQIGKIVHEAGIDAFGKDGRYKRARELFSASEFVLALKKIYGEEWMIKSQDSPDIILAKPSNRSWFEKPTDAIKLEIMDIPQVERERWQGDITQEFTDFVKKKKFLKRFGPYTHLLIVLNFKEKDLDIEKISKQIKVLPNNPYHQIWFTAGITQDFSILKVGLIYPEYITTTIDKLKEPSLFF